MKISRYFPSTLKNILLLAVCLYVTLLSGSVSNGRFVFGVQQRTVAPDGTVYLRAGSATSQPVRAGSVPPAPTLAIDPALEAKIEELINRHPNDLAEWGIEVLSLDENQIIYSHNSSIPMIPASNMKLFTTATAMHYLGADYRFKTAVYSHSNLDPDGTLRGNLVLRGGGDPFFSRNFLKNNASSFFDEIAAKLRAHGVHRIGGNIVGDDSLYPYQPPPTSAVAQQLRDENSPGDRLGDQKLADSDSDDDTSVSALSFNDNLVAVRAIPVRNGAPVRVYTEPSTDYFRIINRATATRARRSTFNVSKVPGKNTIVLTGRLPLRAGSHSRYIKVDDPAGFAAYLLKESLQHEGIDVAGMPVSHHGGGIPYREMKEWARHESPPLLDAISIINKRSVNSYAELLLRLVGSEVRGRSTTEAGISVVQDYVAQTGINPRDVAIYDGSGLSKSNLLSPHVEISLLRFVASQNYYPQFVSSLSVASIDGTLRHRLSSDATAQRIFGKTGTLSNAVALGGFLYTLQGKRLAFAIFCNNFASRAGSARHCVDEIMEVLSRHEYSRSSSALASDSGRGNEGTVRSTATGAFHGLVGSSFASH
ncbi:MAG TPA: D-alanyl-D-alanine carboxypeptidase/D-alanyl-D-alanine-endopeptidase [Acidobacteriota bacterium]|jgi:D-alanyl-D-alanine carboxypeptidase/D-alanyl-D-alanine-endopeptidase (penicillin-binding protein 4)